MSLGVVLYLNIPFHELGQSSVRAICPIEQIESQIVTSLSSSSFPTRLVLPSHIHPISALQRKHVKTLLLVKSPKEMNMFLVKITLISNQSVCILSFQYSVKG